MRSQRLSTFPEISLNPLPSLFLTFVEDYIERKVKFFFPLAILFLGYLSPLSGGNVCLFFVPSALANNSGMRGFPTGPPPAPQKVPFFRLRPLRFSLSFRRLLSSKKSCMGMMALDNSPTDQHPHPPTPPPPPPTQPPARLSLCEDLKGPYSLVPFSCCPRFRTGSHAPNCRTKSVGGRY